MNLKDYTNKEGMSIRELSDITGVAYPQLYRIAKDVNYNVTIKTMTKIASGTQAHRGKALMPWEYLDVAFLNNI